MKIIIAIIFLIASNGVFGQKITQNSNPEVVSDLGNVACGDYNTTFDNAYSRAFKLTDYGIDYDFKITNIAFGVFEANKDFPVRVNLYLTDGNYPSSHLDFIGGVSLQVSPSHNKTIVDTGSLLSKIIRSGNAFVVEVYHDGKDKGEYFIMGTNGESQTAPSYIKSRYCNIITPVAIGTSSMSFGVDAKWIMVVTVENNLGITEIVNSRDLQIYPNPVKDVLNFKLSNGLNIESIEIYDLTGKKINTDSSRLVSSVSLSNLSKGVYALKVKSDDGKIHIKKIVKE